MAFGAQRVRRAATQAGLFLLVLGALVSVIAAYLTFFPVKINALRGLQSADPRALELMRSYAASRGAILWKLRVRAALPYLFPAFKIAATASVVGAIIGALPARSRTGSAVRS